VLRLGAVEVRVLYTPGHSPGGCCLWIPSEQRLIAGDTLFRDSVGRTDLPGGDSGQLFESIRKQLLPLPDETVVIPGHGPETTIGRERRFNPFLQGLEPPRSSAF
jgi:glyoxylase-like metal-dependent hydrolase (beta-lactamase superfamily II)